jgi:hypothetical protein
MTRIIPISRQSTRNSLRIYNMPVTGFVSDSLHRKCALSHCIQRFQGGGGTPTVRSLCQRLRLGRAWCPRFALLLG